MKRYGLILSAIVLSLAQLGFLAWMIGARAAVLRDGTEVLLKVEPVDPRDLLRGDYVRLGYPFSALPIEMVANRSARRFTEGDHDLYVRLRKGDDGYWIPVSANFDAPGEPAPAADEVDLRGRVKAGWNMAAGSRLRPEYGIDRFYVPEGEGKEIERDMRTRSFGVKVAIGRNGEAQIKALLDGDRLLYAEPLY